MSLIQNNCFAWRTHPFISKKSPDFWHFIPPEGMGSMFSFKKYNQVIARKNALADLGGCSPIPPGIARLLRNSVK